MARIAASIPERALKRCKDLIRVSRWVSKIGMTASLKETGLAASLKNIGNRNFGGDVLCHF